MIFTAQFIRLAVPNMPLVRAQLIAGTLRQAAIECRISTPMRAAAFVAQLAHESAGFRYLEELWGPTPAQKRYEGRRDLGNVQVGDGYRYRGRGWIQLTGRANYIYYRKRVLERFGVDIVSSPDAAARPDIAAFLAAWYWADRGLNELADKGNFREITRRINGGYNGLADRQRYYTRLMGAV